MSVTWKHQNNVGSSGALDNTVPPNMRLTRIVLDRVDNPGNQVSSLMIGTSDSGDDILTSTTIVANQGLDVKLDRVLHTDLATSLYLTAQDWNSATFRAGFKYED
jgi:hypothetical protein